MDERVNWFDNVEAETWSPLFFEDFAEQLGYEKDPSLKFYWLLPGKGLNDGLRVIVSDHDTLVMASVAEEHRNLVVYFDHEDIIASANRDDLLSNPIAELPKVLSPHKIVFMDRQPGKKASSFLH